MFSEKATKIDEIFAVDLTPKYLGIHNIKWTVNILSIFLAFLENINLKNQKIN